MPCVVANLGAASCRYSGPRLPLRLQVHGQYVLQVPGTTTVIDGKRSCCTHSCARPCVFLLSSSPSFATAHHNATHHHYPPTREEAPTEPFRLSMAMPLLCAGACENSPFQVERSAAIYANHSTRPNARLECWPVLRPGTFEVRQNMVLVASTPIEAGHEIRIDYEAGSDNYWKGEPPAESYDWSQACVPLPPPTVDDPILDRLQELQTAAGLRQEAPPCVVPRSVEPIAWEGGEGGTCACTRSCQCSLRTAAMRMAARGRSSRHTCQVPSVRTRKHPRPLIPLFVSI